MTVKTTKNTEKKPDRRAFYLQRLSKNHIFYREMLVSRRIYFKIKAKPTIKKYNFINLDKYSNELCNIIKNGGNDERKNFLIQKLNHLQYLNNGTMEQKLKNWNVSLEEELKKNLTNFDPDGIWRYLPERRKTNKGETYIETIMTINDITYNYFKTRKNEFHICYQIYTSFLKRLNAAKNMNVIQTTPDMFLSEIEALRKKKKKQNEKFYDYKYYSFSFNFDIDEHDEKQPDGKIKKIRNYSFGAEPSKQWKNFLRYIIVDIPPVREEIESKLYKKIQPEFLQLEITKEVNMRKLYLNKYSYIPFWFICSEYYAAIYKYRASLYKKLNAMDRKVERMRKARSK